MTIIALQGTSYLLLPKSIIMAIIITLNHAPVAQGIEQRIPNPCAAGSIPARRTNPAEGFWGHVSDQNPSLYYKTNYEPGNQSFHITGIYERAHKL